MPLLENPQHEAFAQARFAGKSLTEAHCSAGYAGDKSSACRLNQLFEVKERIAELYREAASQAIYDKSHAVRALLAIVHACAADANADHPLCEPRLGKEGLYYRFPAKLQAMARLIKLMGWDVPVENPVKHPKIEFLIRHSNDDDPAAEPHEPCPVEPPPGTSEGLASNIAHDFPSKTQDIIAGDTNEDRAHEPAASDRSTTAAGHEPVESAQPPLSARQEAFAIGRVKGLGVMAAYHAAGYTGDSPNLAWRLNSMPTIKARIAELNGGVETTTGYGKDDAIRDLAVIIHANPTQAGPDHPLSEERKTSWGSYHRFPSKLTAIALLIKMLGWHDPAQAQEPFIITFPSWLKPSLHRA